MQFSSIAHTTSVLRQSHWMSLIATPAAEVITVADVSPASVVRLITPLLKPKHAWPKFTPSEGLSPTEMQVAPVMSLKCCPPSGEKPKPELYASPMAGITTVAAVVG